MSPTSSSNRKRQINLFILVGGVLLVVFLGYQLYRFSKFHVVNTSPSLSNVSIISPFLKLNFNRQLSTNNLSVSSVPSIISSSSVDNKTLIITLTAPLNPKLTYTVFVTNISDTKGERLVDKRFTFVPKNVPYDKLSKDQQQALLKTQVNYSKIHSDPILVNLPHSTLDYILDAAPTANQKSRSRISLQAQLLVAPGVSGAEATTATNQDKQEVLDYITSLKLNPANYDIQYQVVNESLTGT